MEVSAVYAQTALAGFQSKAAALYFDYILPFFLILNPQEVNVQTHGPIVTFLDAPKQLTALFPPALLNDGFARKEVTTLCELLELLFLDSKDKAEEQVSQAAKEQVFQALRAVLELLPAGSVSFFGMEGRVGEKDTVSLVLSNLKLVDAEKLSWEHILEVRRDVKSMAKLRRLRLLFHENYSGKPSSYIEDDLLRRVDEYDETVKEWKLDTVQQSLEMVCSSKSLAGTAVPAIVAGLFGGMTLAAAVGSGFEVGKIGLSVWKKHRELVKFKNQNPVSYLVELRVRPETSCRIAELSEHEAD
jgi:hypothetical protein